VNEVSLREGLSFNLSMHLNKGLTAECQRDMCALFN